MYTLDAVVVEADRTKNKFGDTITEQSYYRTGGDVKVITREEIEKRHYTDLTEAIKRIPGVTFQNPGYRGTEYGYSAFNNSISINGDARVIVLINGRRIDNSTSTRFGSSSADLKTMVDLNQVINMEAVDKIEVIKGPGASVYGADATGGVINIITRKGGTKDSGVVDLATGSWDKHVYNLSYSGSAGDDHSLNYFISATRQMSGDTKYHDGIMDRDYTYKGTSYKEDGINFRIEKDFDDEHTLAFMYNHQNGLDHYPITAPYYPAWTPEGWAQTGGSNPPREVYRNGFLLDGLLGAYNAYRTNDLDITYTFNKDNGMESFVRVYDQSHHYWTLDEYPWPWSTVPFPGGPDFDKWAEEWKANANMTPYHLEHEKNRGIQLQYGKSIGIHDLLTSVTFDKAKTYKYRRDNNLSTKNHPVYYKSAYVERDSVFGFMQDKIHITNKWDFTPAIRYSRYSTFNTWKKNGGNETVGNSSSTVITPTINTEYAFDDTMSAYLGWAKIYRPIKADDYSTSTPNGKNLDDEKGNVWTLGFRKDFAENTTLAVHYDWTKMDNAVTYYYVRVGNKEPESRAVNAKETKKSFNITLDTKLDSHWTMGLAYTRLNDEWEAKDGMQFDKDLTITGGDVNAAINVLRPANHYTANFSYENGKWYSGLLINWYTGNDTKNFTDKRFLVLDWNLNYELSDNLTLYTTVTNLTNEAYENSTAGGYGIGAAPQPGRAFMVGARYKF